MVIDLTPLGLDREHQALFCYRRLQQQNEYINSLKERNHAPARYNSLVNDAIIIREAFMEVLTPLLQKEKC